MRTVTDERYERWRNTTTVEQLRNSNAGQMLYDEWRRAMGTDKPWAELSIRKMRAFVWMAEETMNWYY